MTSARGGALRGAASRAASAALLVIACAGLTAISPAYAQQGLESATVMEAVDRLKPGEFLWTPQAAPDGPLLLIVSVATQRAVLYRNGVPIGISTISSGRPGYSTPTGVFTILQKDEEHYSSIYDNAPMPFMQRLTWGGVALHAGQLPGYPASHGCIRLPLEFARHLFAVTRLGMTVIVTREQALPRIAPGPELSNESASPPTDGTVWQPELAPTGPVSIMISGADRRVTVIRNGRVIGSASVDFDDPVQGTQVFLLQARQEGASRWLRFDLSKPGVGEPVEASTLKRFRVSDAFRQAVTPIVAPGTTVVITADALTPPRPAEELIEGR